MNKQHKEPTLVSRVEEAMDLADDFVNVAMIVAATKLTPNQVTASLHHLKKHKVADCLVSNGLWWFLTPGTDDRAKRVEERRPEDKPRRMRKNKILK